MPNTPGSIPTAYLRHNPYSLDTAIRFANRQHIARPQKMLLAKMKMPACRCDAVNIPYAMDMQFTFPSNAKFLLRVGTSCRNIFGRTRVAA